MPLDYYNDNDPGSVAWLEALCAAGEIPAGKVDSRSILDVRADQLSGFRRVHFFAGIGGWAEALGLADWPHDLTTWTGSPPCQPFSVAGKGLSRDDPRHLAPPLCGAGRGRVPLGAVRRTGRRRRGSRPGFRTASPRGCRRACMGVER